MRIRTIASLTALLLGCSCASKAVPPLVDLHSVGDLQAAFDADVGKPRLVLLLSPT